MGAKRQHGLKPILLAFFTAETAEDAELTKKKIEYIL